MRLIPRLRYDSGPTKYFSAGHQRPAPGHVKLFEVLEKTVKPKSIGTRRNAAW
jgi:hypothetical protein